MKFKEYENTLRRCISWEQKQRYLRQNKIPDDDILM
jgi:hypothetical protein